MEKPLISMAKQAKPRGTNYTPTDKNLLICCLEPYLNIIENKRTDGLSTHEKDAAWAEIAVSYNNQTSSITRTATSLRGCFDNLKKQTRKSAVNERLEMLRTDGGLSSKVRNDPVTERIRDILQLTITPVPCDYDSDAKYSTSLTEHTDVNQDSGSHFICDGDEAPSAQICSERSKDITRLARARLICLGNSRGEATINAEDIKMSDSEDSAEPSEEPAGRLKPPAKPEATRLNRGQRPSRCRRRPTFRDRAVRSGIGRQSTLAAARLQLANLQVRTLAESAAIRQRILATEHEIKLVLLEQELVKLNNMRKSMSL